MKSRSIGAGVMAAPAGAVALAVGTGGTDGPDEAEAAAALGAAATALDAALEGAAAGPGTARGVDAARALCALEELLGAAFTESFGRASGAAAGALGVGACRGAGEDAAAATLADDGAAEPLEAALLEAALFEAALFEVALFDAAALDAAALDAALLEDVFFTGAAASFAATAAFAFEGAVDALDGAGVAVAAAAAATGAAIEADDEPAAAGAGAGKSSSSSASGGRSEKSVIDGREEAADAALTVGGEIGASESASDRGVS